MDILLRSLVSRPWFIEANYAAAQLPFVERLMAGESASLIDEEKNAKNYAPIVAVSKHGQFNTKPAADMSISDAGVLILSLEGPMMKETECGIPGTAELISILKAAEHEERILSVVFKTDCPGGTVDGTQEFSEQVANMSKPVYFWVHGMNCSAAAFASAGATGIFASSNLCTFGSIGVMTTLRDDRVRKESLGIKDLVIKASTSPDKNKSFYDALDGKEDALKAELDEMDAEFMNTMRAHRKVEEEALTGSTYLTRAAINMGLCDGVASLEEVVNEAYSMGLKVKDSITTNQ
jgi:protease-4